MAHAPNVLLKSLSAGDYKALVSHLKTVTLSQGDVLHEPGSQISQAYFPHSGVISLVVPLASGEMVESAMVGATSTTGASAGLGSDLSLCKAVVQIAGAASVIGSGHLRDLADASAEFRSKLVRHDQFILAQAFQSAACMAAHKVEARLARWLLRCRDLQNSDDLGLTQEFLSEMLGVRRTSVSEVATVLQKDGLIRYSRGHIRILDVKSLKALSCECYATVRAHERRLIGIA